MWRTLGARSVLCTGGSDMVFLKLMASTETHLAINRDRQGLGELLRRAICNTRSLSVEPRDIVIFVQNSVAVVSVEQEIVCCELVIDSEKRPVILGLMMEQVKTSLCQLLPSSVRVVVMMEGAEGLVVLDSDPTLLV